MAQEQASRKIRETYDLDGEAAAPGKPSPPGKTDMRAIYENEAEGSPTPQTRHRPRDSWRERLNALGAPNSPDMTLPADGAMFKVDGIGGIVFTKDSVETQVEHPDNPGLRFDSDGAKLRVMGQAEITTEVDHVAFNGMAINPRAKHTGTSVVNHYRLIMDRPPIILQGRLKAILTPILGLIKVLDELSEDDNATGG
jgi:hypothetical protein